MSKQLEEYIKQNREAFDIHEPDPAIWLKIQAAEKTGRTVPLRWLRIAAGLALLFAASSTLLFFLRDTVPAKDLYSNELMIEISETEAWYQQVMQERQRELEPFLVRDPSAREMLDRDLEELDQVYEELKEDLHEDVSNTEVIEAMILNYTIKLEILEDLLQQLKEKEIQDENYESYAL